MKKHQLLICFILLATVQASAQKRARQQQQVTPATDTIRSAAFIKDLISKMTLAEKVGQLNQLAGDYVVTDPLLHTPVDIYGMIRNGKVGALLNVAGIKNIRKMQEVAIKESRMHIPLLFGFDVIHGYKTIFPIPLGESCSWDLDAIKLSAHVAAAESAASGLNWTFAPMVDICHDARWGRIAEGAGEDPYYGGLVAAARVKGFQGDGLGSTDAVMACAKHFVGYGAAEGGRDYNGADLSDRQLKEIYLPPFKAAVDAGTATVMTAFNTINGLPATANEPLVRGVLKNEWQFKGFVVSDANSVGELIAHGVAANGAEAATLGINAGCDMDMVSTCYVRFLEKQATADPATEAKINDAVTRILRLKYNMGLFDDPYRYCDSVREKKTILQSSFIAASKDVARKSIVLLKNDGGVLPLSKAISKLAVIGPLGANKRDMMGNWYAAGDTVPVISILDGIKLKLGNKVNVTYQKGCAINAAITEDFSAAVAAAQNADMVVLCLGEGGNMSGEAKSRSQIGIPGNQLALLKAVKATGKPFVVVLSNGRPLDLTELSSISPAILETWFLGTEAGDAIADVLFGDHSPVGRLSVTFPYSVGQLPLYYAQRSTGRAYTANPNYRSRYLDVPNDGLYPFGYGLTYTTFKYSAPRLNKDTITTTDSIRVQVNVTNTGKLAGEELVQLYLHDVVASVSRPVKELKRFKKIWIQPGQTAVVTFSLGIEDLKYYNTKMNWVADAGKFEIMTGPNSRELQMINLILK